MLQNFNDVIFASASDRVLLCDACAGFRVEVSGGVGGSGFPQRVGWFRVSGLRFRIQSRVENTLGVTGC